MSEELNLISSFPSFSYIILLFNCNLIHCNYRLIFTSGANPRVHLENRRRTNENEKKMNNFQF